MMGTAGQVDGLAGSLLRSVDEPDRIAMIQMRLDRFCHRLRNRLNSMKLSLYLARRLTGDGPGADWARTDQACRAIETLIEQLQVFCAPLHPAPTEGDLGVWMEARLADWRRQLERQGIQLEVEADSQGVPLPGRTDWARLGQGLDGLIASWGESGLQGSSIRLSWGRDLDRFLVRFEGEDWMLRPSTEVESLALPLLARVLAAHGGAVSIRDDRPSIELSWPSG
jgi:signal transduction histidine kinase